MSGITYPNAREAGMPYIGTFFNELSTMHQHTPPSLEIGPNILRPKSPVRIMAMDRSVKPSGSWTSLLRVGWKGWLAEASQRSWSGVADMK